MATAAVMVEEEIERPPAGTACRECLHRGSHRHFCPATEYKLKGDGEVPMCQPCAEGRECGARKAVRSLEDPLAQLEDVPRPGEVRHVDPQTVKIEPVPDTPETRREYIDSVDYDREQRQKRNEAAALVRGVAERERAAKTQQERNWREARRAEVPLREDAVMEDAAEVKSPFRCRYPNCTQVLTARSKWGVCAKHYYWGTLGAGHLEAAAKAAPEKKTDGGSAKVNRPTVKAALQPGATTAPVTVEIQLSESQCDALWKHCTHAQKAKALSAVLQQLLAF